MDGALITKGAYGASRRTFFKQSAPWVEVFLWVLAWSMLSLYSTGRALIAEGAYGASRRAIFLTICSLGGGFLVGVRMVKVVSLHDGWSSDYERHIRRIAPHIF